MAWLVVREEIKKSPASPEVRKKLTLERASFGLPPDNYRDRTFGLFRLLTCYFVFGLAIATDDDFAVTTAGFATDDFATEGFATDDGFFFTTGAVVSVRCATSSPYTVLDSGTDIVRKIEGIMLITFSIEFWLTSINFQLTPWSTDSPIR